FTAFLLFMHGATAIGLVIILIPYILLNLRSDPRHSLGIALAVVGFPFLAPLPWIFDYAVSIARPLFSQQPLLDFVDLPWLIEVYGYLPVGFCLLGTFLLAMKGDKKNYGLILGLLALLLMLITFTEFGYGLIHVYYRGFMWTMLLMSIMAGAGLMAVKNLRLPVRLGAWIKVPFITRNAGSILCLTLIVVTLAIVIPARQATYYYHMIDEEDYEAFIWIKENVADSYEKAILDPLKGTPFSAITGKYVYTYIGEYSKPSDTKAYDFLEGGSTDTDFLRANGISIVYTRWGSNNPDLVEVSRNVYLLKEAPAQ
ncbi:MAG: hypothetical protein PHN78_04925, partial [Dehalococcoidales bacterium]|nr:hypothetical protein [Dehalococcoidales bacterium]